MSTRYFFVVAVGLSGNGRSGSPCVLLFLCPECVSVGHGSDGFDVAKGPDGVYKRLREPLTAIVKPTIINTAA